MLTLHASALIDFQTTVRARTVELSSRVATHCTPGGREQGDRDAGWGGGINQGNRRFQAS